MIATALVRAFADHLEVIPSAGGLRVATVFEGVLARLLR